MSCEPDRPYKAGARALAAIQVDRSDHKAWADLARSYGKTDAGFSLMLWLDFAELNRDGSITEQTIRDIPGLKAKEREELLELYRFSEMEKETDAAYRQYKASEVEEADG